jgi:hypothetical protein
MPSSGMFRRVDLILFFRSVLRLLVTANVVPSSLNIFILNVEAISSSEI